MLVAQANDDDFIYKRPSTKVTTSSAESVSYESQSGFQGPAAANTVSSGQVVVSGNMVNVFLTLNIAQEFDAPQQFITIFALNSKIRKPYRIIAAATSQPHLSIVIFPDGQVQAFAKKLPKCD
jgi:hypothetical protein